MALSGLLVNGLEESMLCCVLAGVLAHLTLDFKCSPVILFWPLARKPSPRLRAGGLPINPMPLLKKRYLKQYKDEIRQRQLISIEDARNMGRATIEA